MWKKLPYQERIKGLFTYLPSGKKTEEASNQDLQNQKCGESGLPRTSFHQNLQ